MTASDAFLTAIVSGDRREARRIARERLVEAPDVAAFYTSLVQDALYEVGRRWQVGELTVGQEHAATTTVQYVLSSLYTDLPRSETNRGVAVVAGVSGELHQLGGHMVADVLESDGWRVCFLGADVPLTSLLAAVEERGASLVGLSITLPTNLPRLASAVSELRRHFDGGLNVVIGGQGARSIDGGALGADAHCRDVVEARSVARGFSR